MSGKTKNQHYVPQSYINRFSDPQNKICVYNIKENKIITSQNSRNWASERYYYDVTPKGLNELFQQQISLYPELQRDSALNDSQLIEHILSRIEGDIKVIFDKIIAQPELLNNQEYRMKIIIFLHGLAFRTVAVRQQIERNDKTTYDWLLRMNIPYEQKKNLLANYDSDRAKIKQLHQLSGIAPVLQTEQMLMENYDWYFATTQNNLKLIISDNPAASIRTGFNDICFPISKQNAIIFRIKETNAPLISSDLPTGTNISLHAKSVLAYNCFQIAVANSYAFGDSETLKLLKQLHEAKVKILMNQKEKEQ